MFDTLIELYDNNTYDNLLAAMQLHPRRMIILCDSHIDTDDVKSRAGRFFALRGQRIELCVFRVEGNTLSAWTDILTRIFEKYPYSVLNINGGQDLMLVAAGIMLEKSRLPMFRFDNRTGEITDIRGCKGLVGKIKPPKLTVPQVLAIAGATIGNSGRITSADLHAGMEEDVYKVWDIISENRNAWGRNTGFMQALTMSDSSLKINAPLKIRSKDFLVYCNRAIMEALQDKGIISELRFTSDSVSFSYKNEILAHCLRDTGIWLELVTYYEALSSGCFDDIRICGIIDWNTREPSTPSTSNEVDVIMTRGSDSYFVSCKTGSVSADTLNEIHTLAHRFGGENPHPVISTAQDFSRVSPGLDKRARDMGISIVGSRVIRRGEMAEQFRKIVYNNDKKAL